MQNLSQDEMAGERQRAGVLFGRGMAAVITVSFGFIWMGWGFSALPTFRPYEWAVLYAGTVVLLVFAIRGVRRGRKQLKALGADRRAYWAKRGRKFGIITALEVVGCGIVVALAVGFHRMDLIAVGISAVVGAHFLPLAGLFDFPVYYVTGVTIILCDLVSLSRFHGDAITAMSGIVTGAILWLTGIYALALSRRLTPGAPVPA